MYTIKLTPYRDALSSIFHRQTKNHEMVSLNGKYRFIIDNEFDNPDFWVVQGKGVREKTTCHVAPENVIFLNTEPRSVLNYPNKYLNQFGLVSTSQYPTNHRNVHYGPAILPWFVGYKRDDATGTYSYSLDYDSLKNNNFPEKKKLLSVISSNLAVSRGHINRIKFVDKLKAHYGDQLDVYGRGFNSFDDKWDVLAQYKYHICIENCSEPYYWTEKISDCFLTGAYPFYYGCKNFADYFPKDSFSPIDILDVNKAIATIDSAIENGLYEKSIGALEEAKNLALDKYNMFEYMAALCDNLNPTAEKKEVTLHPCVSTLNWQNFVNYTFLRSYYKTEMRIYRLFHKSAL